MLKLIEFHVSITVISWLLIINSTWNIKSIILAYVDDKVNYMLSFSWLNNFGL